MSHPCHLSNPNRTTTTDITWHDTHVVMGETPHAMDALRPAPDSFCYHESLAYCSTAITAFIIEGLSACEGGDESLGVGAHLQCVPNSASYPTTRCNG